VLKIKTNMNIVVEIWGKMNTPKQLLKLFDGKDNWIEKAQGGKLIPPKCCSQTTCAHPCQQR